MWKCLKCAETIEEKFDTCWSCGLKKDGTMSEFIKEVELNQTSNNQSKLNEGVAFKSFRLEGNRLVSNKSMIPLDSVSLVTYGVRENPNKLILLIVGLILIVVGGFFASNRYTTTEGFSTVIVGVIIIFAALYKTAQYEIVSDSGKYVAINATSNERENQEFMNFATRLLDAKEKYIKSK
jgi:hypothetical protein